MTSTERVEAMRKTIAGFAVLADHACNRGQRKRFVKQADQAYRQLQKFVRENHLPRELAP